jgi:hypothetical protein
LDLLSKRDRIKIVSSSGFHLALILAGIPTLALLLAGMLALLSDWELFEAEEEERVCMVMVRVQRMIPRDFPTPNGSHNYHHASNTGKHRKTT